MSERASESWWTLPESELIAILYKVKAGEDPELVLAEAYANSRIEHPSDDE
jgi:hypothetical protein